MDKVIRSLSDMLKTSCKEISDLLVLSRHKINESSTFGTKTHSIISTFEIISPPLQTASLNQLSEEKKKIILKLVLLLFPIMDNKPEITELRFIADSNMSSTDEFIQFIDDDELINDISIAINLIERKPPKFWVNYKNSSKSNLLEDDYRSEFFRMLGMKYQVGSEEESKIGRTDLILKSTTVNRKIFEFKVWGRNDYLKTSQQLLGYLTEIDDSGFVIIGNSRKTKNINDNEYNPIIKCSEYIKNTLQKKKTNHGINYFQAEYSYNGNRKRIYHFILNLK